MDIDFRRNSKIQVLIFTISAATLISVSQSVSRRIPFLWYEETML